MGEFYQGLISCIVAIVRLQAALAGDHFELRDRKLYLEGVHNSFTTKSFPTRATFDVIFMFALDVEEFGNDVSTAWAIMDPDGRTVELPPENFALPSEAPGVITGWYRILPFVDFQFVEAGVHEVQFRVDGSIVGTLSLNIDLET